MRIRNTLPAALAVLAAVPATAQNAINVPIASASALVGLGTGGGVPQVVTGAYIVPSGEAIDNLQPGSYVEWKVNCQTPGLYHVAINLAQWQDDGCVLAVETRPLTAAPDWYITRYAAQDTRDYGQTNGTWTFMETGDLEDPGGNIITVPLWSGDNVLRIQNVTGRHWPAYTYPTDMGDQHNRDWGTFWGNVHIGRIGLTRVADLPATATVSGRVYADRPYNQGVKRAMVVANEPGRSAPEPSWFWKNGYYTYTRDDGTYSLTVPAGTVEVKAGRPGGYQVQGSAIAAVDVGPGASSTVDLGLTSLFHDNGSGGQTAFIQACYAEAFTGAVGLISVDGENGYKMGWVEPGDSWSAIVDAPRAGYYTVRSAYFNGGNSGVVTVANDAGGSVQGSQPNGGWDTIRYADYPGTLYLRQGPNIITQTLISGASDFNAVHLTAPPVIFTDATRALQIAAGLILPTPSDAWMASVSSSDPGHIGVDTAVRLLQAVNGRPL